MTDNSTDTEGFPKSVDDDSEWIMQDPHEQVSHSHPSYLIAADPSAAVVHEVRSRPLFLRFMKSCMRSYSRLGPTGFHFHPLSLFGPVGIGLLAWSQSVRRQTAIGV